MYALFQVMSGWFILINFGHVCLIKPFFLLENSLKCMLTTSIVFLFFTVSLCHDRNVLLRSRIVDPSKGK